jgi:LysR family transcriptional regulator, carnitine catabolism transcriptional activator
MNPTLRQLQAFVLAYRLGVLTRAADQLFITQSAASVLIKQLEDGLGIKLFDRTSRALRPTTAAHEILPTAERMLRDLEALKASARGVNERRRGRLTFASTPSVAAAVLPTLLADYRIRYPEVEVAMQDVAPDRLTAPVLSEEVEFSIGTLGSRPEGIELQCLTRDHISAICLADSPLAHQHRVTWDDVLMLPCITVKQGNGIRDLIDAALRDRGERMKPAYEVSYLSTALSFASANLGVAVLPAVLLDSLAYHKLTARRIEEPTVPRDIQLITHAEHSLSPPAVGFVELWYERMGKPGDLTVHTVPRETRAQLDH